MPVVTKKIRLSTKGEGHIIDITAAVSGLVAEISAIKTGIVTIFVPGATGALTTIEYEAGLLKDFKMTLERLVPKAGEYFHDISHSHAVGNAHSHIRASFLGPSLTIPLIDNKLQLGQWQQIVFIDFDSRPRERELILQMIGE